MEATQIMDKIKNLRSEMENQLTSVVFFHILLDNELYYSIDSLAHKVEYNQAKLGGLIYDFIENNLDYSGDTHPIYEAISEYTPENGLKALNCQEIAKAFLDITDSERNKFMKWMIPDHYKENPEWFVED